MGGAVSGHQALSHNGKIYVLGGDRKNDVWSSVNGINWSLETSSAGWTQAIYRIKRYRIMVGSMSWASISIGSYWLA